MSDHERHTSFLWKLVEYSRATRVADAAGAESESDDFDFRVLHRLFVNRRVGGQREITVNPFFGSTRDSKTGESSFSILKYLYRSDVKNGERVRRVLFIPVWRGPVDDEGARRSRRSPSE